MPLSVVKDFNVFKNLGPSFFPSFKTHSSAKLYLQAFEETFHNGIVIAITLATHAGNNTMFFKRTSKRNWRIDSPDPSDGSAQIEAVFDQEPYQER